MSIPVSFYAIDLIVRSIVPARIGTMSYGSDLSKRETWLNHIRRVKEVDYETMSRFNAFWIKDFTHILVLNPEGNFIFTRAEIYD
jgi:hypothetical protein